MAALSHTKHAVGCASGTDALLLPLKALDLKPGDEVITTPFTFFATAGAIHNAGGTPVFVDIEPDTFNIDPAAVEAAITPRTRGIVVVHLFGQMAAMEALGPIAARHGVALIEDAAQSIGARRKVDGVWRVAGELGTVGTLSFFPSKNLGAYGDGGMMVTQDDALAARLQRLRLHGGARQYYHDEVGFNSRLDTLQAAVLLAKLPHLADWSAARARECRALHRGLRGTIPTSVPRGPTRPTSTSSTSTRSACPDATRCRRTSSRSGIGNSIYYPLSLHLQPCFAYLDYAKGSLPISEAATEQVISLPVYPELSLRAAGEVIDAVLGFYA